MATHIYHGPWVNWANGGLIRGATVTVSDRSGGLLTTFIATFVTLVGAQLWKILCFTIHQLRSTTEPEDGLFHQQQAIWRNTTSPGGASWTFLQQAWYWRKRASQSFLRTISWSLFSILYLVIFAAAAVFSSDISKAPGSQRLVVGKQCGFWAINNASSDAASALTAKMSNDSQTAANYAAACYGGSNNTLQCSRLPQPSISYDSNPNATCPFASGMCIYGDTAAYQMTSKLMDSQYDLGINTPDHDRLQMQKRTTCAPVTERGSFVNETSYQVQQDDDTYQTNYFWEMMYGPWAFITGPIDNSSLSNYNPYTYSYNTQSFHAVASYQLVTVYAIGGRGNGVGWRPISQLSRDYADVLLFFLSANSIRYEEPNNDPWFRANYPIPSNVSDEYWSNEYVTTMGCAEEFRFCNPVNNKCGDYMGYIQSSNSLTNSSFVSGLGLNAMQQFTAQRMSFAAGASSMYQIVYPRAGSALVAQKTVTDNVQAPISDLQWHIEVSSWFDAGLAAFQQKIMEYATGPATLASGARLYQPAVEFKDTQAEYQCYAQLLNDGSETMSFSLLGMAILFILGAIIIFTSLVIDRVVALLQKWFKFNMHGAKAWALDDKLQLQKTVFEKSGMGHWKEDAEEDSVPATTEKTKFRRFMRDPLFGERNPDTPPSSHDLDHEQDQALRHGHQYEKVGFIGTVRDLGFHGDVAYHGAAQYSGADYHDKEPEVFVSRKPVRG